MGNISSECCDTITLDDTNPTCGVSINGDSTYTACTDVRLNLSSTDGGSGVEAVRIRNAGQEWGQWLAFQETLDWTLIPGEGHRTVCVTVRDSAGNICDQCCDMITLDQTSPTLTLGVLQNPILTNQLDLYLISSESLDSTSVSMMINEVDVPMSSVPGDISAFRGDYRLMGSGTVTICAGARDLAGISSDSCRTFTASHVLVGQGGVACSSDSAFIAIFDALAIRRDDFVLVFEDYIPMPDRNPIGGTSGVDPLKRCHADSGAWSATFTLSPACLELARPIELRFDVSEGLTSGARTFEVYEWRGRSWKEISSHWDISGNHIVSFVDQLGTYKIRECEEETIDQPEGLALGIRGPYPSPFTTSTRFILDLPVEMRVDVRIYDPKGRLVDVLLEKRTLPRSSYVITWHGMTKDGVKAPSGVYVCAMRAGHRVENRRVILLR